MIGTVAGMKRDLHHLHQGFTMMKDTMASELSVLDGTVPNNKEMHNMERQTIEVDEALANRKVEFDANKRGLEYVIGQ
eukprot:7860942-Prorocentrum_lima.AAC.1